MAKRVLAVVGAVALVLVAVVVRSAIDDDGGGGGTGGDRPTDGQVLAVCDTDLAPQCRALTGATVRVEPSATTSASIVDGTGDDIDVWVTTHAWVELTAARVAAHEGSIPLGAVQPVAIGDVALGIVASRADAMQQLCGGTPSWRCLGDNAGRPWAEAGGQPTWGAVRTGLPDADTAVGLEVLASVATGYFGNTTFAANDFAPEGFDGWLARLTEASGRGDRDLLTTLVRRQGTYDAGGVLAHQAAPRPELVMVSLQPTVAVPVVAVQLGGDPFDGVSALRGALVEAGWTPGGGAPAELLGPGVMGALHDLWKDVTR